MNPTLSSPSPWDITAFPVSEYLACVGVSAGPPSVELLEQLHTAHVHTFPFSNVEVLLDSHPGVQPATVADQLLRRRRGGYCFEHAQLFAGVLEQLGFSVHRGLGRVRSLESARTHTVVFVDLEGTRYLCDPGFGFSITGPVALQDGATRDEAGRTFSVGRTTDHGWGLWTLSYDGHMQHAFDEATVHLADLGMGHLLTSTHPNSVFRNNLMLMKWTPEGHVTVTQDGTTLRRPGQATEQVALSAQEVVERVVALGVSLTQEEQQRLEDLVIKLRSRSH